MRQSDQDLGPQFWRLVDAPIASLREAEAAVADLRLSPGPLRRAVPMELRISPWWSCGQTLVELLPRRRVTPTGRYFDTGNRWLDDLAGRVAAANRRPSTRSRSVSSGGSVTSKSASRKPR